MTDIRVLPTKKLKLLLNVFSQFESKLNGAYLDALRKGWDAWVDNLFLAVGKGASEQSHKQTKTVKFNDMVQIFRLSKRGERSDLEISTIKRFLVENVTSIPWAELREEDKLCLANEVDWQPIVGRSIVFLQGDFGNVYYMIGAGTVGLYLEKSEDKQMSIAREFGDFRGKEFPGDDEDLQKLGHNIANLPAGIGFGEVAILSDNHKFRSCAAVCMDRATLLLVVHASTYNKTLRKVHQRQQQMSGAMELLMSLPTFRGFTYASIATLAFELERIRKSNGSMVQAAGAPVKSVYIITAGAVKKVLAPPKPKKRIIIGPDGKEKEDDESVPDPIDIRLQTRTPNLGVVVLGRGQIIGESEVFQGLSTYAHGYVSQGVSELFEVPVEVFQKTIREQTAVHANKSAKAKKKSMSYTAMQEANLQREHAHEERTKAALSAASEIMGDQAAADGARLERLGSVLPSLLGQKPPPDGIAGAETGPSNGGRVYGKGAVASQQQPRRPTPPFSPGASMSVSVTRPAPTPSPQRAGVQKFAATTGDISRRLKLTLGAGLHHANQLGGGGGGGGGAGATVTGAVGDVGFPGLSHSMSATPPVPGSPRPSHASPVRRH